MVLIVDDHPDGGEAVCRVLNKCGFPCQTASNGRDALAAIRAHPREMPLLVLLDHMMPLMNGVEVLREIRGDPKIADTTVIFYSAGFDVGQRDEAMTMGAAAWLLKGISFQELIDAIDHWYERVGGVRSEKRPC